MCESVEIAPCQNHFHTNLADTIDELSSGELSAKDAAYWIAIRFSDTDTMLKILQLWQNRAVSRMQCDASMPLCTAVLMAKNGRIDSRRYLGVDVRITPDAIAQLRLLLENVLAMKSIRNYTNS